MGPGNWLTEDTARGVPTHRTKELVLKPISNLLLNCALEIADHRPEELPRN